MTLHINAFEGYTYVFMGLRATGQGGGASFKTHCDVRGEKKLMVIPSL